MGPYGSENFKTLYSSRTFHSISAQFHGTYPIIGGILDIKLLGNLPVIKNLWGFEFFLNTGPYRAGSFKTLPLLLFSSDFSQTSP